MTRTLTIIWILLCFAPFAAIMVRDFRRWRRSLKAQQRYQPIPRRRRAF